MSRFRSLSEAVRYHVDHVLVVHEISQTLPLSVQSGQGRQFDEDAGRSASVVLRWGNSTWGVEPVTGYAFPGQKSTTTNSNGPITQ